MDDTQQSRASDAAATRKRRSSILKSQRPARTPFSELEFNVATPTDTAKSRRVSFSKRTGVAEFITNEGTTTWKNFYEEHNKSLESSGNDSDVNAPRQPVQHLGKRIFDQQFEEVEAVDFIGPVNPTLNCSSSVNNFTEQIASLEYTSDAKLPAPQNQFELSALTDHQSKLFGNDFTVTGLGELSGRIQVNFSTIERIGEKDDLDEIERDLERASNVVCQGPSDRHNLSEYIEVDLNVTNAVKSDECDMSITDTIQSPKVQNVSKNCSIAGVDKDWVTDKENIAINPYVAPRESDNFAVNEEPNQVLVFDGKRLTLQTEQSDQEYRKTLLPDSSIETPQRKTIVLNINDDLPNFANDVSCKSETECKPSTIYTDFNLSMTLPVTEVKSMPNRKTILDTTGNISLTQALSSNIISGTSEKRRTMLYEEEEANISMTQALPAQIINDNANPIERRRTVVYDNDTGNISITQALPNNIIQHNSHDEIEKRKTIIFDDTNSNISVPKSLSTNLILEQRDSKKRNTIVFDNDSGNISITQALPSNVVLDTLREETRRTIIYEDNTGNISITQAAPSSLIFSQRPDGADKRRTIVYEDDTGNISVTQAVPQNIILGNMEIEQRTQIFDEANISMTEVLPTNIVLKDSDTSRRRTIVYESSTGNISITQGISSQILSGFGGTSGETASTNDVFTSTSTTSNKETAGRRRTIIYDDNAADISMTQPIPANIIPSQEAPKMSTTEIFDDICDLSFTQTTPATFLLSGIASVSHEKVEMVQDLDRPGKEQLTDAVVYEQSLNIRTDVPDSRAVVITDERNESKMFVTETNSELQKTLLDTNKRRTIIFDKSTGNLSMTVPIPADLMAIQDDLLTKYVNKRLDLSEQSCNVQVYQAVTDDIGLKTNRTEQGDLNSEALVDDNTSNVTSTSKVKDVTESVSFKEPCGIASPQSKENAGCSDIDSVQSKENPNRSDIASVQSKSIIDCSDFASLKLKESAGQRDITSLQNENAGCVYTAPIQSNLITDCSDFASQQLKGSTGQSNLASLQTKENAGCVYIASIQSKVIPHCSDVALLQSKENAGYVDVVPIKSNEITDCGDIASLQLKENAVRSDTLQQSKENASCSDVVLPQMNENASRSDTLLQSKENADCTDIVSLKSKDINYCSDIASLQLKENADRSDSVSLQSKENANRSGILSRQSKTNADRSGVSLRQSKENANSSSMGLLQSKENAIRSDTVSLQLTENAIRSDISSRQSTQNADANHSDVALIQLKVNTDGSDITSLVSNEISGNAVEPMDVVTLPEAEKPQTLEENPVSAATMVSIMNTLLDMYEPCMQCEDTSKNEVVSCDSLPKNEDKLVASDTLFYITREEETEVQTDNNGSQIEERIPENINLPEIGLMPPAIEFTKLAPLEYFQRTFDALGARNIDEDSEGVTMEPELEDTVEKDESMPHRMAIKSANDTRELLDMISDFTDKTLCEVEKDANSPIQKEPITIENKMDAYEPKRLSFVPSRQSIIFSREDLLNNISMAQLALQKSRIELGETSLTDTSHDENTSILKKSGRLSNEVVKTLHFDDESLSGCSLKSEPSKSTPLKKTAFADTSYMRENKANVIPSYLKDISEGIKELMSDLVKPMADVLPFESAADQPVGKSVSTMSTQIQANLVTSSQIDMVHELTSKPESVTTMAEIISRSSSSTNIDDPMRASTDYYDKSYELVARPRVPPPPPAIEQTVPGVVLVFDHDNPLNNILIRPVDYGNAHKYSPITNTATLVAEMENAAQKSDETLCGSERSISCQIDMDPATIDSDIDSQRVTTQYNVEASRTFAAQVVQSEVVLDCDGYPSDSKALPSRDQSIEAKMTPLKDIEVNTVIVMKGNKELLDASSSLTLVDDILDVTAPAATKSPSESKSTGSNKESKSSPSKTESKLSPSESNAEMKSESEMKVRQSPTRDIYKIEEQKGSTEMQEVDPEIDSKNGHLHQIIVKGKKRIYHPTTPNRAVFKEVEVTPKPSTKMQKLSLTPVVKPTDFNKLGTKIKAERDVDSNTDRGVLQAVEITRSREKPRRQTLDKAGTTITIQQLITEYQSVHVKQVTDAIIIPTSMKSVNSGCSSAGPISQYDFQEYNSLQDVSSFTSSKNLRVVMRQSESTNVSALKSPSNVQSTQSTQSSKSDWHPQLSSDGSTRNLSECDSSVNIVAKIDMLPFMGSHECEWESASVDTWSFRLMHGRIRLTIRLAHRHSNASRSRVKGDALVDTIAVETAQYDKKNPVATLCVRFACETMRYMVTHTGRLKSSGRRVRCVARDVPPLLRRCAAVARVALRWGRAMHEAKLHLAYTLDNEGHLALKVANIPLRSVWEVTMDVQLVVEDARQAPWPCAGNVRVARVLSDVPVGAGLVQRVLADTPRDWGHAPRTLWRIFRYLKHKTRDEDILLRM